MISLTASWSLSYTAIVVAMALLSYRALACRPSTASLRAANTLMALGTLLLWTSLVVRHVRGHGWPFQTSADLATGIVALVLPVYFLWRLLSRYESAGWIVSSIAALLLTYTLIRQPPTLSTIPQPTLGVRIGTVLNLAGAALLALATAASLTTLNRTPQSVAGEPDAGREANDLASEGFVRAALLCLALSLAIDTWWLQKVGLGNSRDAQQAGIAVTWMVYFVAIRLRSQPDWKGWPWTAVVTAGFGCALPILLNVPWLEATLPL